MTPERYVVLGLAHVRSEWFRELGRWATDGSLPVEFVKCISAEEVRARLASARPFSALIADGALPALDRDLVDQANAAGCAVVVVSDVRVARDWSGLGAAAVLAPTFGRDTLAATLAAHASMVAAADRASGDGTDSLVAGWQGRLVAVTGGGGSGRSTIAMALAQGLANDVRDAGMVLLADLALHADLAMLHDTGDVVPGLQELVEAHRSGRVAPDGIRRLVFDVPDRRYHLLLGLRRHRDWVVLRPRAVAAALDGLLGRYRTLVADVDADLEGEAECGSVDIEERNVLARTVAARADLVLVVGQPGPKGLLTMTRVVDDLRRVGVEPARVVPVVNRAPRSGRGRAEIVRATAGLMAGLEPGGVAAPLFVADRRGLDDAIAGAGRLPAGLTTDIAVGVRALLHRLPAHRRAAGGEPEPDRVAAGRLGSWTEDAG